MVLPAALLLLPMLPPLLVCQHHLTATRHAAPQEMAKRKHIGLLAGGSGLTPMLQVAEEVLRSKLPVKVWAEGRRWQGRAGSGCSTHARMLRVARAQVACAHTS